MEMSQSGSSATSFSHKADRSSASAPEPFSYLPELAAPYQENDKEVTGSDGKQPLEVQAYALPQSPRTHAPELQYDSPDRTDEKRGKRSRKRVLCVSIILIVILTVAIGLGVGLGVGLTNHKSQSNSIDSGSTTGSSSDGGRSNDTSTASPKDLSTRGVFNGSSISIIKQLLPANLTSAPERSLTQDSNNFLLFFQHYAGDIRWIQYINAEDAWHGGSSYEVIASDAKNATPISSVAKDFDFVHQTHVFYVNNDNTLRERVIDNQTYRWFDGALNDQNIRVLDADATGMLACFYGGPIANMNLNGTDNMSGIRLWVATEETRFEQYAWRSGMSTWAWEQSWHDMNGHASPTCYSWAVGQTTYVFFVNVEDQAVMYWRDAEYGTDSTATHPLNSWQQSSISFGKVDPIAGLSYRSSLFAKMADDTYQTWNISFAAENSTTLPSALSTADGDSAVPNTRISAWALPPLDVPEELLMFYQRDGNDITMSSGTMSTGTWLETTLPIPDD